MGSFLYSWATDLKDLCSTDKYSEFFNNYFMESDVCLWTFIIGLGIAVAVCSIFYFGICNKSYALSTRLNWFVALIVCGVITFFASLMYVKGHDGGDASSSTGLYLSSYTLQDNYAVSIEDNDDQLVEWNQTCDDFRDDLSTGVFDIINMISLINTLYATLLFILMSFCVKGATTHGKNIPA